MVQFQNRQIGTEHKKEGLKTSKRTHLFGKYLRYRGDNRGYRWGWPGWGSKALISCRHKYTYHTSSDSHPDKSSTLSIARRVSGMQLKGLLTRDVQVYIFRIHFLKMRTLHVNTITCCHCAHSWMQMLHINKESFKPRKKHASAKAMNFSFLFAVHTANWSFVQPVSW